MKTTVLIFQMDINFGEPTQNLEKLENFLKIQISDSEKKYLVVVPELFLTGYHRDSIEKMTKIENSPEFKKILELSKTYQVSIFGSIPKKLGGEPYNTAILVEDGVLLGQYRKSHLFGPMGEKELFSRGDTLELLELGDMTIGPSICYDLRFPELYRRFRNDGANVLLICAEWPIQRIQHWYKLLQARAIENQITVIACNRVGNDPNYQYGGHSAIIDSYGEILISAEHDKETVLEYELETDELTKFRNNFDTRIDNWIA